MSAGARTLVARLDAAGLVIGSGGHSSSSGAPRTRSSRRRVRGQSVFLASNRISLPLWRLPEFNFVALWIHHPSEFPVLRVVGLLEHVATFLAQCLEKCCQILDSIVDHEGRLARSEVGAFRWTD